MSNQELVDQLSHRYSFVRLLEPREIIEINGVVRISTLEAQAVVDRTCSLEDIIARRATQLRVRLKTEGAARGVS